MAFPHRWAFSNHAQPLFDLFLKRSVHFERFSYLHSNAHPDRLGKYRAILAMGSVEERSGTAGELDQLKLEEGQWWFGHLSYNLKVEIEDLPHLHPSEMEWLDWCFFKPCHLLLWSESEVEVYSHDWMDEEAMRKWLDLHPAKAETSKSSCDAFEASWTKSEYLERIAEIKRQLQYGNIYELNFCMPFAANAQIAQPFELYQNLNQRTEAPFSAFYKRGVNHLYCASPERFMCKRGNRLYAQPIKGTAARAEEAKEDELLRLALYSSEKERAENVMIVDLMRNDLSRVAQRSSVEVEELFGIYTYKSVHQMVSTISAKVRDDVTFSELLRACFPMGSMTGAPKPKAMELIDRLENFNRGLYSGSIGYMEPNGDFDFNVVIRSLEYRSDVQRIRAAVGSAITILADPEREYEECLLKARSLLDSVGALVR